MIDDGAITQFLTEQQNTYHDVENWSYVSQSLQRVQDKINYPSRLQPQFLNVAGNKGGKTGIFSISENYLDTVNLEYFLPTEIEADLKPELRKLANG